MPDEIKNQTHSLIMQERKKLILSGVCDVCSFDERMIIADTVMGELTVKGEGLHIAGFNRETGDMSVDGRVVALAYTNDSTQKGSFLSRVFK